MSLQEFFIVFLRDGLFWLRRFRKRRLRVNGEGSVVWVFFLEIVFRFNFWIAIIKDIQKTVDDLLCLITS
jgi:hypothetical protein